MAQVPGTPPTKRQGTRTARTTPDSDATSNLACSPNAVRRSLGDMLGVYREARAVCDLDVLARQENAALTFDVVLVIDAGRADDVLALGSCSSFQIPTIWS